MTVVPPMPCRASKAVIQEAAEKYAGKINFLPGDDLFDLVHRMGGRIRFREFATPQPRESIHVRAPDDFDLYLPFETTPARDRFLTPRGNWHKSPGTAVFRAQDRAPSKARA